MVFGDLCAPGSYNDTAIVGACRNNPVNILVDTRLSRCRSLTGAFKTITSVQDKSELNRIRYQRLLIEHIFQAVFGPDGCDLSSLQLALEVTSFDMACCLISGKEC